MGWVIALSLIAVAAYIIIHTAAMALEMTGVSRDVARFQALSAFFGVGFTTSESELVVDHPARRRIIRDLIIIGNIGILSIIGSVVATLVNSDPEDVPGRMGLIVAVLIALYFVRRLRIINTVVDRIVRATLERSGVVRVLDYERLLGIRRGFSVSEVFIEPDSWLVDKTLMEAKLHDEGINVLAVLTRDGKYHATPNRDTRLRARQTIIAYGRDEAIHRLAARQGGESGHTEHEEAVRRHLKSLVDEAVNHGESATDENQTGTVSP